MANNPHTTPGTGRRSTLLRLVPAAWLAVSATWAAVIVVTDQMAWPLVLWIAITLGPVTAVGGRRTRIANGFRAVGLERHHDGPDRR